MPADWSRVKELLGEALERPAADRAGWLAGACGGDAELQAEVQALLAAHERAGDFLATGPSAAAATADALLGARLGPYLLTGVLGRGGMGVVYRARREQPEREVAVKVLAGALSAPARRRFEEECRILARLEHPHVARLFDVGATGDGRPYIVMELVEGLPLDRWCERARLDLRARLELFLELCEAVSYAHARLVVHRDLKPGNVLVDASGRPRLLDFGIARLLEPGPGDLATETGLRPMTPEFASPEQVRGEATTVATDVHGLGLLLHLLLTGRRPFHLRSTSAVELVQVVCLQEPPAPSLAARGGAPEQPLAFEPPEPPQRLARELRGDLDAIVARATRKEPGARYASVERLADDVRRYLEGEPVLAREGRWRYRLGKFVGRHRLSLGLAAGLVLALAAGLVATAWQARVARAERARAERRFAQVRQLATDFLFEFHDAIAPLPGSTRARELVVRKALVYLDGLAAEAGDDAGLRVELARAYQRVGRVQGLPGDANLGDVAGARASLEKAATILADLPPGAEAQVACARFEVLVDLERTLLGLGEFDRHLALVEQLTAEFPASRPSECGPAAANLQVSLHRDLATERVRRGWNAQALVPARDAVALAGEVERRWPSSPEAAAALRKAYRTLAELQASSGDLAAARATAVAGVEHCRAHLDGANAGSLRGLGVALIELAQIESHRGEAAAASRLYAESLRAFEDLAARDPANSQTAADVASVLGQWCGHLNRAGVRERPRDVCRESLARFQAAVNPDDAYSTFNVAAVTGDVAWQAELAGQPREALRLYERALAATRVPALATAGTEIESLRAHLLVGEGRASLALDQRAAAAAAARRAVEAMATLAATGLQDLEDADLWVRAHVLLARASGRQADPAACAALGPARPVAARLRGLAAPPAFARETLADFDGAEAGCPPAPAG